jgi:hypothetical protein
VAAHAKITFRRETRLLAMLVLGERLEAAARAIDVSTTAIRKRASRDPVFAERLRMARADHPARSKGGVLPMPPPEVEHWTEIAARLERSHPEHWALPGPGKLD